MTDIKNEKTAGQKRGDGMSSAAKKIRAAVTEGKHVLQDKANDAKDVATIAGAKVRIATRDAMGDARRATKKKAK